MAKTTVYGSADIPLADHGHDDCLDMGRYAEALARFVLHCETPMTVGIQGEWGAGKTSLMRMMHTKIRESSRSHKNLLTFDFETWQYGAVGRDSDLGFLLMRSILRKIYENARSNESVLFKVARIAGRLAPLLARAGAEAAINTATLGKVDGKALSHDFLSSDQPDSAAELSTIRDEFAQLIAELTGGTRGKGRAIIFVDDLDRIHPEKAVSLMEIMKNFMDVPRCIFVLACDYEVVRKGVAHRLGIADPEKAEAFFHKIIQVPFSMPTHSYKIERLLDQFIKERVADARLKRETRKVARMIESAIGTNPRSIKRFLNRVDLHSCLGDEHQGSQTAADVAGLMALVAMQMRWPRLAAHLAKQRGAAEIEALLIQLRDLSTDGIEESEDLVETLKRQFAVKKPADWRSHTDLPRLQAFIDNLWDCLDTQPDGALSEEELSGLLRHATGISLTSVETDESRKQQEREQTSSMNLGEIEDEFSRELIAQLFMSERKNLRRLQMVNNGDYFQVYPKDSGKLVMSIQKRTGGLLVHLGTNVEKRDSRLTNVASFFRGECARMSVPFTEQADRTRCSLDLKSLGASRDEFRELLLRTLHDANAALTAPSSS